MFDTGESTGTTACAAGAVTAMPCDGQFWPDVVAADADFVLDLEREPAQITPEEVADDPGQAATWLAESTLPTAETGRLLMAMDFTVMSDDALLGAVRAAQAYASFAAAVEQRVIGALRSRTEDHWEREDLAVALGVSSGTALNRLETARQLTTRLSDTLSQLQAGRITLTKARLIATEVRSAPDDVAVAVQAAVLPRAGSLSYRRLQNAVRQIVMSRTTVDTEQRHRVARSQRGIRRGSCPDGMAWLSAVGPAEDIAALWTFADASARRVAGALADQNRRDRDAGIQYIGEGLIADATGQVITIDQMERQGRVHGIDGLPLDPATSMDALRFDALAAAAHQGLSDPSMPAVQGRRPRIAMTMSVSMLLGLDDHPAWLDGYGWITAQAGRRNAADRSSTWIRLLTDPVSGTLLDRGRTTYRPPRDLADHVMARDRECCFPNCPRLAWECDLDHARAWIEGGTTQAANLRPLCRRHHRLRHEGGWRVDPDPDRVGDYLWTDPAGRVHRKSAQVYATPDVLRAAAWAEPPGSAVEGVRSGAPGRTARVGSTEEPVIAGRLDMPAYEFGHLAADLDRARRLPHYRGAPAAVAVSISDDVGPPPF